MIEQLSVPLSEYSLRLDQVFKEQLSKNDTALIQHIVGGDLGEPSNLETLINLSGGKVYISALDMRTLHSNKKDADGRTVYLTLDRTILVKDKKVDTLRFKGVRPQTNYRGVATVYKGIGMVQRSLRVDDKGDLYVARYRDHPHGGIEMSRAEKEFHIMEKAENANFFTDYPVGLGTYQAKKFGKESLGFVVAGMEGSDRRFGLQSDGKIQHLAVYDHWSGKMMDPFQEDEAQISNRIGQTIRAYHDAGYFHQYPHPTNIGITYDANHGKYVIILRDLDGTVTREKFEGDYEFKVKQEAGYRFIDLTTLIYFLQVGAPINRSLDRLGNLARLIRPLLEGYFYDRNQDTCFDNLVSSVERPNFTAQYNRLAGMPSLTGKTPKETVSYLSLSATNETFGRFTQYLSDISVR